MDTSRMIGRPTWLSSTCSSRPCSFATRLVQSNFTSTGSAWRSALTDMRTVAAASWVVAPKSGALGLALVCGENSDGTEAKIGGFSGVVLGTNDVLGTYQELHAREVFFVEPR